MTHKLRTVGTLSLLAAATASCLTLSGCGGGSTASGNAPNSGPVVYGINYLSGQETSGLGPAGDNTMALLVGATAYTTISGPGPIPAIANNNNGGIPLGFAAGGDYINGQPGVAVPLTSQFVFRAYASNGSKGGDLVPINPGSLALTSSEVSGFSLPLTFDPNGIGTGPLANGQYATQPFTLPAPLNTTGVHNLRVTIADQAGQQSATDFAFVAVGASDGAAFVQVVDSDKAPVVGATVSITNAVPGARAYQATAAAPTVSVTDAQGEAVVFAAPGTQTITVNSSNPTLAGTGQVTLTAGQVTNLTSTASVPTTGGTGTGTGGTGGTGTGGTTTTTISRFKRK